MTAEQTKAVAAAKEIVEKQISKREESKSTYFESSQKDGAILEYRKNSLPIEKTYAGNSYYVLKTKDHKDLVLSKLAQSDVDRVFGLIGTADFKLRADLLNEVTAVSKKTDSKYIKRIFEYSLVE